MKTYNDLPTLVKVKILAFASSGANGDLDIWKQSLPLLSVCHDWRVYGKDRLYRYAVIELVNIKYNDIPDDEAVTDSEGSDRESVSSLADSVDDAVALDGGNSVRANSNLKLIQKLGLGSMVKQLLFDQKKPLDYMISRVGSLKAFTSVLQALFRGLPEEVKIIEPFAQMVDLVHMGMIRDNIMLDECLAAFKSATDVLINKYPNVNSIIAMPAQPHEVFQKLIVDLAVGYDKQLTKFVCDMPVTVPYTLLAPNLVELDLRFIHSWTLKFPTIYPRSLRKIDIVFEDVSIDWDVFHVDKESKAIVFDNLTDLSIKGDAYILELRNVTNANDLDLKFPNLERLFLLVMGDSDEEESNFSDEEAVTDSGGSDWESVSSWDVFCADMKSEAIEFNSLVDLSITGVVQVSGANNVMNANDLDLVFPKLERLYLENISLTGKDAEAIMGHGLKRFSYVGSIIAASHLCKQPLRNLDTLILVWVEKQYSEEADDFVTLTNEIFNKTDGIEHVHCEIRSAYYDWSMVGIDWPYLTHLSLGFMISFKELFDMLPKVPNLVFLNVDITKCIDHEFAEATELLTNIKKHYPAPSSSKIKTLRLVDENISLRSNSCCKHTFGGVIENLKWYWPQLRKIDLQDN
ncbi:hypothetical protein GGH12_000728 [Coemansia sp. RSA 1822]|nr:hypothetical protein GGH12_000728 [Coemansia sp. RSA 1822]